MAPRITPHDLTLVLVTDRHATAGRSLTDCVEAALRGGVRAVQLRERDLETRDLLALAHELRALTRCHRARLLINDRADIALACDADGLHLPGHSFRIADARTLLGPQRLIGVSTHTAGDLQRAEHDGADYAFFGPVFDTPSKRPYGPPQGLDALTAATAATDLPVIAIGGIESKNAPRALRHGARGVAAIRALLGARDPQAAAAGLVAAATWPERRTAVSSNVMTVSEMDREYMRRIGVYKDLSHREAHAAHLALSLDERLRRSWRLYRRYRHRLHGDDPQDDPARFYERARQLGLYQP